MRALLALLACLPLVVAAQIAQPTIADPVANKRAVHLAEQLRCLVCQNQSIAESTAELAVDLRRQINEQIASGKTDAEIVAFMVDRYGDFVLYRPPFKATTLLLWLGPALMLVLGAIAFLVYLRARRKRVEQVPLSADERREAQLLLSGRSSPIERSQNG
jgi:cytochrome c-type biogenesis protein CcmH